LHPVQQFRQPSVVSPEFPARDTTIATNERERYVICCMRYNFYNDTLPFIIAWKTPKVVLYASSSLAARPLQASLIIFHCITCSGILWIYENKSFHCKMCNLIVHFIF